MELFQLKYFLAVAKYEHVTKAAESLHIAQPAVSQAIRHLEEEFDTPLFDRENRHITLNATGKMLQKRLTPIMAALDAIPDEIKEAAQQNQPVIHLNLRSASSVITNCIIAYREIHPEVKLLYFSDRLRYGIKTFPAGVVYGRILSGSTNFIGTVPQTFHTIAGHCHRIICQLGKNAPGSSDL